MSRELFEKWRNGKNDPSAGCDCDYDYWAAGFQSGHAAGLERAEDAVDNIDAGDSCCIGHLRAAAAAIRAMKEPK